MLNDDAELDAELHWDSKNEFEGPNRRHWKWWRAPRGTHAILVFTLLYGMPFGFAAYGLVHRSIPPGPLGLFAWMGVFLVVLALATFLALAGECSQTDSTVTCCLKQNPGQYERCGTTPPAPTQPLVVGPPGIGSQGAVGLGESKADKQKRFLPHYVACIDKIGLRPGGLSGTSHCQDCYNYCVQHGFWPLRVTGQQCPEDRR